MDLHVLIRSSTSPDSSTYSSQSAHSTLQNSLTVSRDKEISLTEPKVNTLLTLALRTHGPCKNLIILLTSGIDRSIRACIPALVQNSDCTDAARGSLGRVLEGG